MKFLDGKPALNQNNNSLILLQCKALFLLQCKALFESWPRGAVKRMGSVALALLANGRLMTSGQAEISRVVFVLCMTLQSMR